MNIQSIGSPQFATPKPPTTGQGASVVQPPPLNNLKITNPKEKETPEELQGAVSAVNDFVSNLNNSLRFSIDEDTGNTIVKVVDATTKEVIKQIPSEEMVAIAKALDKLQGMLVHQKA